jgi:hypothetical protein
VSVLRGGRRGQERGRATRPVSACGLLGWSVDELPRAPGTFSHQADESLQPLDVYVAPELLADLYEPRLVITPDYVGRDRRFDPARRRPAAVRDGHLSHPSVAQLLVMGLVAMVTAAVVVPLTLLVSHAGAQPIAARPATQTAPAPLAASAGRARRGNRGGGHHPPAVRAIGPVHPTRTDRLAARNRAGTAATAGLAGTAGTAGMASPVGAASCNDATVTAVTPRCARAQAADVRRAQRAARQAARAQRHQSAAAAAAGVASATAP